LVNLSIQALVNKVLILTSMLAHSRSAMGWFIGDRFWQADNRDRDKKRTFQPQSEQCNH